MASMVSRTGGRIPNMGFRWNPMCYYSRNDRAVFGPVMSPPVSHTVVLALLRVSQVRGPQVHCLSAHQDKYRLALVQKHSGSLEIPNDQRQWIELGAHDTGGMQRDQSDVKVSRGELVVLPTM